MGGVASALRVAECLVTPLELGLLDFEQRGVGAVNGGAGAHGLPSTFPPQTDVAMEERVATLGLTSTGPSPRRGGPEEAERRVRARGADSAFHVGFRCGRQSGISLEKEKRSVDSTRGVATASGGASILCSWLVAREVFAGLSIARRSPPARGRERLTKAFGLEMLDRRAAAAETRKASVKAIGNR